MEREVGKGKIRSGISAFKIIDEMDHHLLVFKLILYIELKNE